MKTLTVAEFKAQFGRLTKQRIPILVRNRKVPVGVWQPLDLHQLKAKQAHVLKGFVNLGRSAHQDIARWHDEYLYGNGGQPPIFRSRARKLVAVPGIGRGER